MLLAIERTTEQRYWSARRYTLSIRAECAPGELEMVHAHGFDRELLYVSPEVARQQAILRGRLQAYDDTEFFDCGLLGLGQWDKSQALRKWSAFKDCGKAFRKIKQGTMVTLGDCLRGVRLHDLSIVGVVEAEHDIRTGFETANYLIDALASFEDGDTVLLESDQPDWGIGPADWNLQPLGRSK